MDPFGVTPTEEENRPRLARGLQRKTKLGPSREHRSVDADDGNDGEVEAPKMIGFRRGTGDGGLGRSGRTKSGVDRGRHGEEVRKGYEESEEGRSWK
jgi:hypothetical protein